MTKLNDIAPRPLPLPGPWHKQGACRGMTPRQFYSENYIENESARAICASCEVRSDCLEYALHNRIQHGIWGGKTELERRRIRRTTVSIRPTRIVIPAVKCPVCESAKYMVPFDLHGWRCLDCRVNWPALAVG